MSEPRCRVHGVLWKVHTIRGRRNILYSTPALSQTAIRLESCGIGSRHSSVEVRLVLISKCPRSRRSPLSDTGRIVILIQRAAYLSSRYKQLGGMNDLNNAIVLGREALSLCPPGHANRLMSLYNLAIDLSSRYKQLGRMDDLNDAIVFGREALSLRQPGDTDCLVSLNNLAGGLSSRYISKLTLFFIWLIYLACLKVDGKSQIKTVKAKFDKISTA